MALTERTILDQILIHPETGFVGWRLATIIERDGVEISRTYHREAVEADAMELPTPPVIPPEVEPHRQLVQTPAKAALAKSERAKAVAKMMADAKKVP